MTIIANSFLKNIRIFLFTGCITDTITYTPYNPEIYFTGFCIFATSEKNSYFETGNKT